VAEALDRASALPLAEAARLLLDAALEALGDASPWPPAATQAVRRRLVEASGAAEAGLGTAAARRPRE
jgi:hypothetical protein